MADSNILDLVQQRAESLAAEKLRSTSAAIGRLKELIAEANRLGHGHAAIHARLRAGGLDASWNNYRASLVRARKTLSAANVSPARCGAARDNDGPPNASRSSHEAAAPEPTHHHSSSPSPSATRALDALAEAKQLATRDYAQVARDLHRKNRK
ncbi:hypothetical protein J7E70_26625 [Variovorax paradoxus]|nr:hypothetical protein [Variovorax paradoxus]MBT2304018.1 hypothetical protein [Variovorax paradoxus]